MFIFILSNCGSCKANVFGLELVLYLRYSTSDIIVLQQIVSLKQIQYFAKTRKSICSNTVNAVSAQKQICDLYRKDKRFQKSYCVDYFYFCKIKRSFARLCLLKFCQSTMHSEGTYSSLIITTKLFSLSISFTFPKTCESPYFDLLVNLEKVQAIPEMTSL